MDGKELLSDTSTVKLNWTNQLQVTFIIVTWDLSLIQNMSRFIHYKHRYIDLLFLLWNFYRKCTISAKFCSLVYFISSGVCPKQSHYLKCLITKINKQLSSMSSYICLFTKDNFNSVTFCFGDSKENSCLKTLCGIASETS